jgi:hypothetical protein
MGQQQMMTVAVQEKGGGAIWMKRMILVLAVAALMAAMLLAMASPAFAKVRPIEASSGDTTFKGLETPSGKINLSIHTHPPGPQGGGGGGAVRDSDALFDGLDGKAVETPSENGNGNYHGES